MAVGGGSDLVGMVKEHLVAPDVLVHLKAIRGNDGVAYTKHGALIGGLMTLDELSRLPLIRSRYPVLAEAAESVGTPLIGKRRHARRQCLSAPVGASLTATVSPALTTAAINVSAWAAN
jgi:FAD binding domain in molybdopterin dehydrogenase